MFLKVKTNLTLIELGNQLIPESTKASLSYDYENVYEWIYLFVEKLGITLNVSREHGYSETDNKDHPGATYFCVHDDENQLLFDKSIRSVAQWIADTIRTDISIHSGQYYIDTPETECVQIVPPSG